ncbi:Hypothetical predicted protein [Pelobates cultripes]|uniref:Reverse transcriptase domain-containing protein n=1 Tax=Pelobates cultripes TaxID=61616 RepID=A0AAD1R5E8_PELCU|nr:Hypothetical predicted protein [Pelobates cultripes]
MISTLSLPTGLITLVTCDVKSLYTIIPHTGGVQAMKRILASSDKYMGPPIEYVMEILELVLTQNYFRFELEWYRQSAGTSMGTAMAPMYANGYMFEFETQHILEPFKDIILSYSRYIDDIFMIIKGDNSIAESMVQYINSCTPNVQLTTTMDPLTVDFLDVRIIREGNKLAYTLFTKSTDRNTLLQANSFHPNALKQSLPYSQFLRVMRNNSDPGKAEEQLGLMWEKFQQRGYSDFVLRKALDKCYSAQATLEAPPIKKLVFPTTYTTASPQFKQMIEKNWRILRNDMSLPEIFCQPPMMCYRRNKNLKDLLVAMVMTLGRVIERDAVRLQTYVGQPAAVPVRASMESDVSQVW